MKLTTGYKKPPTDVNTTNANSNILLTNGADIPQSTFVATSGGIMSGPLATTALTVTGAATFSQAINGSILGNAATASRLQNARTISLTGAVTGSGSFDGSGNLSIATTKNHDHAVSITAGGSSSTALSANTTYTLTVGGSTCVFTTPADQTGSGGDGNTWRGIYTGGTSQVGTGTGTKAINFVAGNNIGITYQAAGTSTGQSGNANYFNIKVDLLRATFGDQNNGEHNANNITSNGLWYYTSNGPDSGLGAQSTDGALYSQAYSTNWVGQIAQDYRNGRLFIRSKNNGTWTNWKVIPLGDDNFIYLTGNGICFYNPIAKGFDVYNSPLKVRSYSKWYNKHLSFKISGSAPSNLKIGFSTHPNDALQTSTNNTGDIYFNFDGNNYGCYRGNGGSAGSSFSSLDEFELNVINGIAYFFRNGSLLTTYVAEGMHNFVIYSNTDPNIRDLNFGHAASFGLSNVAISNPTSGQVLKYNGTSWVNGTDEVGTGGGTSGITALGNGYWSGSVSGTTGTYAPFTSKQSGGCFYTGTTAPNGTTRLNYNGYFYATKLYSGGSEVSTTTYSALSTSAHASGTNYVIKGSGYSGTASKFLREDGTWQTVSGGGSAPQAGSWAESGAISNGISTPTLSLNKAAFAANGASVDNLPTALYFPGGNQYYALPVIIDQEGRLFVAISQSVANLIQRDKWKSITQK